MTQHSEPLWISLAQAVHSCVSGSQTKHDHALPHRTYHFEDDEPCYAEVLEALLTERLHARGRLSRLELDRPAIEEESGDEHIGDIVSGLRAKPAFLLGRGSEAAHSEIYSRDWWYDGVIWEKSLLWVRSQEQYEDRARSLRIERYTAFPLERPYSPEQLIFFADVEVPAADFEAWRAALSLEPAPARRNERNAGRPALEDWPRILDWIERAVIETEEQWASYMDLWGAIPNELKRDPRGNNPNADGNLRKQLERNRPDLLMKLGSRIRSRQRSGQKFVRRTN